MTQDGLLKLIAESGYNIGYAAKKHLATFDIVEKVPGWIGLISIGAGMYALFVPALEQKQVSAAFLLIGYRRELSMEPYPAPNETAPLLLPIGGKHRKLTRGGVHAIVKQVFEKTASRFRERGPDFELDALRVLQASAHWLRHTAGSHMTNGAVDLRHVRDNLGHESISTTNIYLHSPDDVRHTETEAKHRIDW